MRVVMIFKHGKRFRYAPSFNNSWFNPWFSFYFSSLYPAPYIAHWFEWGNTVHQIVAMPYIFTIDLKLVNFNRKRLFEGFNNIKAAARSYQGYMKVKTTEAQTKFNFWHIFASVNAKWVVYTLKSLIICS